MFKRGDKVIYAHPISRILRLIPGRTYTVEEYHPNWDGLPVVRLKETGNIYRPERFEPETLPPIEAFL